MATIRQDFDETARLVLMEGCSGLIDFSRKMREVHPNLPIAGVVIRELWTKYRGFDGRTHPTHDYETGERFRRSR